MASDFTKLTEEELTEAISAGEHLILRAERQSEDLISQLIKSSDPRSIDALIQSNEILIKATLEQIEGMLRELRRRKHH